MPALQLHMFPTTYYEYYRKLLPAYLRGLLNCMATSDILFLNKLDVRFGHCGFTLVGKAT